MPVDDLLRFIGGPLPVSPWWLVLGLAFLFSVIVWSAAVFVWTLPPSRLRRIPVIRAVHIRVNRRRFVRAIHKIDVRYRDGRLTSTQASAGISRTLRSFLYVATGARAQYMHVRQIADGPLASAAPLLGGLNEAQFNPESQANVVMLGRSAEELISSWN